MLSAPESRSRSQRCFFCVFFLRFVGVFFVCFFVDWWGVFCLVVWGEISCLVSCGE